MEFMTKLYLFYSFLSFYSLFLFILIFFQHRKKMLLVSKPKKEYEVACIIPCYNEETSIGKTIEMLVNNGYKGIKQVIAVDDRSTDNSYKIMKEYEKKYPGIVIAVQTPKNTGNAAGAKNYGVKFAKTELMVFTDADSYPEKGAVEKMVGFFDEENVGAVTASVLVKNRNNFLLRMQALEYVMIKFTRKLLEFVDSIYVTPGPLAMYRKKFFDKIGGFDEKNLTEDIEITWRFLAKGYDVRMSVPSRVYSIAPDNMKDWFKQRIRWNMGGLQAIYGHRKEFFGNNMLGYFVLPLFVVSWILGIFGLGFFTYRSINWLMAKYLSTTYSVAANAAIMTFDDLSLNPDILFFFGMILFVLGLIFTVFGLFYEKEKGFKRPKLFDIMVFMFFYLLTYPVILVMSMYKLVKGDVKW